MLSREEEEVITIGTTNRSLYKESKVLLLRVSLSTNPQTIIPYYNLQKLAFPRVSVSLSSQMLKSIGSKFKILTFKSSFPFTSFLDEF